MEVRETTMGPTHPKTLASVNNLAALLKAKGDLEATGSLFHRALDGRVAMLGPSHLTTLVTVNNRADI